MDGKSVASRPSFSIGIEEEYQTIDPETRDLRSHIQAEIVQKGKMILAERVKPEMHQSVVEIGTSVCHNVGDAKAEIRMIRQQMVRLAHENGLRLAAGGSHPFAEWRDQAIYPDERYRIIVEDLRPACAHRRGRPRDRHPAYEWRPVFPAAPAGALR
jgi:carboxylate-amine ligase